MVAQWLESLRSLDLRELEAGHPGDWSARRKSVVALALTGFVLLAGYLLQIQSPLIRLQEERATEVVLKTGFEARASHVAGLDANLLQMQELENSFRNLVVQLPRKAEVPGLLDEIARIGLTSGLRIEHIHWLPEVLQSFYTELPLQMSLVGGYHDFGLFVSGLASLPRVVTAQDFTLAALGGSGSEQLRMTLLATTYRTHDQGLVP